MENGVPGITLAECVDQFCIASYNDKRAYYINHLFFAKLAWRDIFWNTIFRVKRVSLPVIYDGDTIYLIKPKDCVRLLSVSFVDECGYHPLLIDGDILMPTIQVPLGKSCQKCNSSLCSVIDTNITTRTEIFGGTPYILKTYYNTLATGEVYRNEEQLVYDEATAEVKIEIVKVLSCTLETLPCGCPKPTTANATKLVNACGCTIDFKCKAPIVKNDYGYFNHDFDDNRIYLKPADKYKGGKPLPARLDVSHQTSTENLSEDLIVPEYGILSMFAGINYYRTLYKPNTDSRLQKQNFLSSKTDLLEFMYPIDLEAFRQLQGILPQWG